ncbi:MAG: hypothetical protein NTW27_06695 [Deltaproteobacteria bacterium]|nr:hypothetical protein [Deltaproteobacteria bacterium]
MVRRMIVVLGAVALIMTMVGLASAQVSGMNPAFVTTGDMIMIPMKVTYSFERNTGGTPGGDSSLFMRGCEQYTGGFRPWGTLRATTCAMKVKVQPPKCVAPTFGGPVQWGAPPSIPPNSKLCSNIEKFQVISPGCNPCMTGGMSYDMTKKQTVSGCEPPALVRVYAPPPPVVCAPPAPLMAYEPPAPAPAPKPLRIPSPEQIKYAPVCGPTGCR